MGAAIISGVFAVVLACLAWVLKNGSRRARLLSRIERYTQILKDLPEGHPARAHLDAALAADSEQLLGLTGRAIPTIPAPPQRSEPSDPWSRRRHRPDPGGAGSPGLTDEDPGPSDWMGDEPTPSTPGAHPGRPDLLAGRGSTILWVLAGLFGAATVALTLSDLLASRI